MLTLVLLRSGVPCGHGPEALVHCVIRGMALSETRYRKSQISCSQLTHVDVFVTPRFIFAYNDSPIVGSISILLST